MDIPAFVRRNAKPVRITGIDALSDEQIEQFKTNVYEGMKLHMVEDAGLYAGLKTTAQKLAFLDQRIGLMVDLRTALTGQREPWFPSANGTNVTGAKSPNPDKSLGPAFASVRAKLEKNKPDNPERIMAMMLELSNPSERAKVETYFRDLGLRVIYFRTVAWKSNRPGMVK